MHRKSEFVRRSPRQARAQATFDAIVEATVQILRAEGLSAINTNAVAERAGVSIGSLYQYFLNRDALMIEVIKREQQRHVARIASALPHAGTLELDDMVRLIVRTAMAHHREDAIYTLLIENEVARLSADSVIAAALKDVGDLLEAALDRFQFNGVSIDGKRLAQTLPAMVHAITVSWSKQHGSNLDIAEDEAVRAATGYLIKEPGLENAIDCLPGQLTAANPNSRPAEQI